MAKTNDAVNNKLFGEISGSPAAAGYVGELISSQILAASSTSLTTNVLKNLTSISLTAGDWDVWGNVFFIAAGTTIPTAYFNGISIVNATLPDISLISTYARTFPTGKNWGFQAPDQRINISSTTTVYMVAKAVFTVSTMTMCGGIYARRRR